MRFSLQLCCPIASYCRGECHRLFVAAPTQTKASIRRSAGKRPGLWAVRRAWKPPHSNARKETEGWSTGSALFLQSCASCIREHYTFVQGPSAGRTQNEVIWGWPWQELPCEAVLVCFNEFWSWSPEQHIRTAGPWRTGRNSANPCWNPLWEHSSHSGWIPQCSLKRLSDQNRAGGIHHYLLNSEITILWPTVKTVAWQLACCWSCGDVKTKVQRCRKHAAMMVWCLKSRCPSI